jgi:hypothetical protein
MTRKVAAGTGMFPAVRTVPVSRTEPDELVSEFSCAAEENPQAAIKTSRTAKRLTNT